MAWEDGPYNLLRWHRPPRGGSSTAVLGSPGEMTHPSGEVALVAGQGHARSPEEVAVVASGRWLFETYIRRFWPLRKAPEEGVWDLAALQWVSSGNLV